MSFSDNEILNLIELYRERASLWDPSHSEYKNKDERHNALTEIAESFGVEKSEIEKKIRYLQSHFSRERKKEFESKTTCSSADEIYESKWFAYKPLLFLVDKRRPRKAEDCVEGVHRQRQEIGGSQCLKSRSARSSNIPTSEASFIPGTRGKQMLLLKRYKFCENRTLASDETKWRCSVKSCGAWVKTWGRTTRVSEYNSIHNHDPLTAKEELKLQIAGAAKRKARDEPEERPGKIFQGLIDSLSAKKLTTDDVRNVKQAMYRERRKKHSRESWSPKKTQEASEIMDGMHTTKEEQFLLDSTVTDHEREENFELGGDKIIKQEVDIEQSEEDQEPKLNATGLSDFQDENTNDSSSTNISRAERSPTTSASFPIINTMANRLMPIESQRHDVRDEFTVFGELVAIKLRNLTSLQSRYLAQSAINEALFKAEMGMFEPSNALNHAMTLSQHPQLPLNINKVCQPSTASNSGIPMATSEPSRSPSFVRTTLCSPTTDASTSPDYHNSPLPGDSHSQLETEPSQASQLQMLPSSPASSSIP